MCEWIPILSDGENNNDGEENNQSWNCGLGPHEDGENATPIAKMLRDRVGP